MILVYGHREILFLSLMLSLRLMVELSELSIRLVEQLIYNT